MFAHPRPKSSGGLSSSLSQSQRQKLRECLGIEEGKGSAGGTFGVAVSGEQVKSDFFLEQAPNFRNAERSEDRKLVKRCAGAIDFHDDFRRRIALEVEFIFHAQCGRSVLHIKAVVRLGAFGLPLRSES